jgi:hypothetical protein
LIWGGFNKNIKSTPYAPWGGFNESSPYYNIKGDTNKNKCVIGIRLLYSNFYMGRGKNYFTFLPQS